MKLPGGRGPVAGPKRTPDPLGSGSDVDTTISLDDVEVKGSPIEGLGLFARRSFLAGECIRQISVVREVTTDAPLREDLGERSDHCDYPDGKIVLLGFPDRHVNHSCDPNAYVAYQDNRCYLVARRTIPGGSEITCDYNINLTAGTSWPCHCGAARCRGETVGDFFQLPPDIQREYRPLLAAWFVNRHRDRVRLIRQAPGERSP